MKKVILSFIFIFVLFSLFAQSNYNEAIQQGDSAFKRDEYTSAIKKYLIAETFDQSKWKIVQERLDAVYAIIDKKQKELKETIAKLNYTIEERNVVTAEKEKLENKVSSAQKDVYQIKQKLESLETQMRNVLETMDTVILQTNKLENNLLPTQNSNTNK